VRTRQQQFAIRVCEVARLFEIDQAIRPKSHRLHAVGAAHLVAKHPRRAAVGDLEIEIVAIAMQSDYALLGLLGEFAARDELVALRDELLDLGFAEPRHDVGPLVAESPLCTPLYTPNAASWCSLVLLSTAGPTENR